MVRIDIDLKVPRQKLSQQNINRAKYALANQALADMNQFVPADEFVLRQTGRVSGDAEEVIWDMPYAARMFYMMMRNYTTPGTGPRWDNKAKAIYMNNWLNVFKRGAGW